jgi:putative membrane protein
MFISLLVKGFLIGIAFVIPGLSGGTMAVYLGLYQKLLEAIGGVFKHFRKSLELLVPVGIGLLLAIVLFAGLIGWLLTVHSLGTLFFFLGLMIGGMKKITAPIRWKQTHWSGYVLSGVAFLLVIGLFLGKTLAANEPVVLIELTMGNAILVFFLGMAAATTMIVPGVSGSALLVVLGYYTAIVTNVVGNLFDFSVLSYNLTIVALFGLGGVSGIYLVSKGLNRLITDHESESMLVIVGFLVASMLVLFLEVRDPQSGAEFEAQMPIYRDYLGFLSLQWASLLVGAFTFAVGFFGSRKLMTALKDQ